MNWINNVVRPKIRGFLTTKRDVPDNLWVKCPETGQMVFYKDLEANQFVFPGSEHHERMTAPQRLTHIFGEAEPTIIPCPSVPTDPLKFRDARRYTDRIKDAKAKTELDDAVVIAEGPLDGVNVVVAVQDFRFMAGSLGMAAGEAVIAGMLHAVTRKAPFILFAASGGARMQEGIISLMQMPRTTIAVQRLRDAGLPYIVVLTDPTTGGVTASYAMLGDIQIAEPGALICFAGPRVIQQTIREQLPDGFQRAEYLLAHGMIDMVVHRHKLRETLVRMTRVLMRSQATKPNTSAKAQRGMNGKAYRNGSAIDNAPENAEKTALIAEPVPDQERFDPARRNRDGAGDASGGGSVTEAAPKKPQPRV
ncbi:MAG: acetyl-CoA carboxylase carboxyltransferase subunit beta [Hyphomicrobiaceae bacterium]|nr:acetyl-CoA carboxylase carboxyltransferase subunit beta [Hyphomicrobiaceae bacterium]